MAVNKNGIVVLGAIFVDIKGFPEDIYVPDGRNAGHVEYIHGGVSRNVVEDIANLELRPTFLGIADNTALGEDVVRKLQRHKVNTEYMKEIPNGMGTWLAVFDHNGDLAGSISQRPNLMPILGILEENGDEIIANCDSVVAEIDMDKDIIKKLVQLCEKHEKKMYGVVSNMNIAVGRRDLLQKFDCLICNQLEAGVFFSDDYSEKTPEEMREAVLAIREKMAAAAREAGRDPAEVQLCAACKTRTAETVAASAALPIDVFGENHVQELCANFDAGAYCGKPSHFIGHLQTNKIKKVLGRASLIQSVGSEHLLTAIEKEAAKAGIVQNVLLEVNIGGEESKSGVSPEALWPLLDAAAAQEHIRVKGLMAIPPVNDDDAQNRRYLAAVHDLFVKAGERGYSNVEMQTLSMGMSGDYENAIREGATLVRIGTAIYGERDYRKR